MNRTTANHHQNMENPLARAWGLVLLCFVIAASAGLIFRWCMIRPLSLDMVNLRHAHSHLMSFGWLTPGLFILMTAFLGRRSMPIGPLKLTIIATLVLALLSFPIFALYGYQRASIAGQLLPAGVMVSTASMFCWYGFAGSWWVLSRNLKRDLPLLVFDLALVFLVLSTFGAWGIAAQQAGLIQSANPKMLTHWFLLLFKEGWIVLAVMGLLFSALDLRQITRSRLVALSLLVLGLPFSVPLTLGVQSGMLPGLARIGGWMVAVGLMQLSLEAGIICLQRRNWTWILPIFFLCAKCLGLLLVALLPLAALVQHMGTAIFYLHILLLGGATLGLLAAAPYGGVRIHFLPLMSLGVVLLLVTMVPFTLFWPPDWFGFWCPVAVLAATTVPLSAMVLELVAHLKLQVQQDEDLVQPVLNPIAD